jgi:hypothetical protein
VSWLLPSALAIGGIAAIAAIALHFIARSRPIAEPLPTARFIPQRPIHARTRSLALSDVALLLVRLAALLALAGAVAGPVFAAARGRVARVIVADRSRDVASVQEVRDSVRALLRAGDVLIAFDSDAVVLPTVDSLRSVDARGSLSAALALALRAGGSLATRVDSVELVVVSPFTTAEVDEATARLRGAWPGRARLVRTRHPEREARRTASPPRRAVDQGVLRDAQDDAVVAGLSLMGAPDVADFRLVRGRVAASDSAWARDSGHVLIHWPSSDANALWPKRVPIDAIGAVASSGGVLVARFPRLWTISGRAIARWADGEPAAVERAIGTGCIRDVAIVFDPAGDATLRAAFRSFARPLLEPCGGDRTAAPLDSASVSSLAGSGPLAPAGLLRDRASESSRWTPWLLAAVALLLLLELAMRRSGATRGAA